MLLELISYDYTFEDKVIIFFTFLLAMLVAMTLHEFAHSFVAYKCGDPTPKAQGRLTLNPMAHLEPAGFMSFLILGFGWAKPVAVNTFNFKKYKRDMFLVSIAGVVVNITLAFIFMPLVLLFIYHGYTITNMTIYKILAYLLTFMVSINILLFVFNLFPIHPLDGFNAIASYLRYENPFVVFMRRYGTFILLGVLIIFDIIYSAYDINVLNYICYYVSWPLTQFWSWIFGAGSFNILGFFLYGVI